MECRVLQQHDGLAVGDAAVGHHLQGFFQVQFQHFDVFTFLGDAAAGAGARC